MQVRFDGYLMLIAKQGRDVNKYILLAYYQILKLKLGPYPAPKPQYQGCKDNASSTVMVNNLYQLLWAAQSCSVHCKAQKAQHTERKVDKSVLSAHAHKRN